MEQHIEQNRIISGGKICKYLYNNKIYDCILFENEMYISLRDLASLLMMAERSLEKEIDLLLRANYFNSEGHKYFFYDGNKQSFKGAQNNFYNLDACIALSIQLQSYDLLDYIFWARNSLRSASTGEYIPGEVKQGEKPFISINYFEHGPKDVVVPHQHTCYELVYYISGMGRSSCEHGVFEYNAHSLLLMEPGVAHEEYIMEKSRCICLAFNSASPLQMFFVRSNAKTAEDIQKIYQYLIELLHMAKSLQNEHECDNYVIFIVYLLNKILNAEINEKRFSDETVEYVKGYIQLNYPYKINFNILCERIGYSLSHMRALFKKKEGCSLYSYLSNVRLLKAKEYLKAGKERIQSISKKCGFSSEARFSQFFKSRTGVSPQVWREISNREVENGILFAKK